MKYSDWLGAWAGLAIGILIVCLLGGWLLPTALAALWTGAVCVKWHGANWAEGVFDAMMETDEGREALERVDTRLTEDDR